MKKILLNLSIITGLLVAVSCDKDYNTIGTDVVDNGHYDFDKKDDVTVIAYTQKTGAVQSNNLPINTLGVFDNATFGSTVSSFVTQVELAVANPDFGFNPTIDAVKDSVYLYVPYYSTVKTAATGNGETIYELNSVYGDVNANFDLKIYENGYYLRDFDVDNPSERQKFYSDEKAQFYDNRIDVVLNNNADLSQNSQFVFSDKEIRIFKTDDSGNFLDENGVITTDETKKVVKERLKPGMWITLDKSTFESKILQAAESNLVSNSVFKQYFKGLLFSVTENNLGDGALAQLDFSQGYVVVQYHSSSESGGTPEKKSLRLNLRGNTVNFFENNLAAATDYENALNNPNIVDGDENLFLKGGDGSVVLIDLFGNEDVKSVNENGELISGTNGVPDELDELRAQKILINDAYLTFYVKNNGQQNTNRIYLYDAENNIPIIDYNDSTTSADPKLNKYIYGGILEKTEAGDAIKYTVRLGAHLNKIINQADDSANKNVRLALSVTENINITGNAALFDTTSLEYVPVASVMSSLGTVVFGNTLNVAEDKKLKLEIYYTKPN